MISRRKLINLRMQVMWQVCVDWLRICFPKRLQSFLYQKQVATEPPSWVPASATPTGISQIVEQATALEAQGEVIVIGSDSEDADISASASRRSRESVDGQLSVKDSDKERGEPHNHRYTEGSGGGMVQ